MKLRIEKLENELFEMHERLIEMELKQRRSFEQTKKAKRIIGYIVIQLKEGSDVKNLSSYLQNGWTLTEGLCDADRNDKQAFVKYE